MANKNKRPGRKILNRKCSIEGCSHQHKARGLCNMHWKRAVKEGLSFEEFIRIKNAENGGVAVEDEEM